MIPTPTQFKADIEAIYPEGNIVDAYTRLKWHYANTADFTNPDIYAIILKKFSDHVEAWKRKYGERDEKYISENSRKELKNIFDFLGANMWQQEFKGLAQTKLRDKYLFPKQSTNTLKTMLHEFEQETGS